MTEVASSCCAIFQKSQIIKPMIALLERWYFG